MQNPSHLVFKPLFREVLRVILPVILFVVGGANDARAIAEGERVTPAQSFPSIFYLNLHFRVDGGSDQPQWAQADCSATLIHPRVLLTAAHCLTQNAKLQFALNGISRRGINTRVAQATQARSATEGPHPDFGTVLTADQIERVIPHPDFETRRLNPFETIHRDVGVVILKQPMVGVTPMKIRTQPVAINETVRLVGYGASNVDFNPRHPNWNFKLTSSRTITEFQFGRIRTLAGIGGPLEGDSGGALILESTQELIGVISGTSRDDVLHTSTRANFAALDSQNLDVLDQLTFETCGFHWNSVYAR